MISNHRVRYLNSKEQNGVQPFVNCMDYFLPSNLNPFWSVFSIFLLFYDERFCCILKDVPEVTDDLEIAKIRMPGALPMQEDTYMCTSFQSWNLTKGREVYIRSFQAEATAKKAHLIILQKCDNPPQQPGTIWLVQYYFDKYLEPM